jgi:hypothetical protein
MLNHARPRETGYTLSADSKYVEMRTLVPLAAGREVHDTYGALGSAQLLANFGFSLLHNIEPDGSSNDVRDLPLPPYADKPTEPADGQRRTGGSRLLVYKPPLVAPLRIGPKRYALGPFTTAVDAFRVAAFGAHERSVALGEAADAKRLQGAPLEVRALKRLIRAVDSEVQSYSMHEDAAAAALHASPALPAGVGAEAAAELVASGHWARRAAAAAALVLNEQNTLQFYRLIASICLEVLAATVVPPANAAAASEAVAYFRPRPMSVTDRRRAAAHLLYAEVKAETEGAKGDTCEGGASNTKVREGVVASLRRHASRDLAAPVALAFLQIRFPALLAQRGALSGHPEGAAPNL